MSAERLVAGLAQILEVEPGAVDECMRQRAGQWDSVEVFAAIALLDEVYGKSVPARELAACRSAAELAALVERSMTW